MQKEDYKKIKRLSLVGILFTVLFAVMLTNYIREQKKEKLEAQIKEDVTQLNQTKKRFNEYFIPNKSNEKKRYKTLLTNYHTGIKNQDTSFIEACQQELKTLEKKVIKNNTSHYKKQVAKLEKGNLENAYDNELERISEIKEDIKHHISNNTFLQIDPLLKEWKKLLVNMSSVADNLTIQLKQIEANNYPTLKLYLSVHDINTDKVPTNLEKRYFYLSEQIGSESAQKLSIDSLKKENELKEQNINFVTSIQTSTKESTLPAIIKSANYLLRKSDFDSGSQIELLNANNGIQLLQPFTSDKKLLKSKIKTLQTSGKNNLYDLLYTALKHTINTSGTKYIIAFTDGEDNSSSIDYTKVIEIAKHYHIPIYLIGIGDQISTYTLERIATQTGGFYRNINDGTLIEEIIDTILKEQNDLYQVTYTSKSSSNDISTPLNNRNILIAYQNRLIGGSQEANFSPTILMNESSKNSTLEDFHKIDSTIRKKLKKQIATDNAGTLLSYEFINIKKQKKNIYEVTVLYTAQQVSTSILCQITTKKVTFLLKKSGDSYLYKKQLDDIKTLFSVS